MEQMQDTPGRAPIKGRAELGQEGRRSKQPHLDNPTGLTQRDTTLSGNRTPVGGKNECEIIS